MRRAALVLLLALLLPAPARAKHRPRNRDLLQVVAPTGRAVVAAHPFVNVVVRFGNADGGAPADPTTFRARLGGTDVSAAFHEVLAADGISVVGKRAMLAPPAIRLGRRPINRLRLDVRATDPRAHEAVRLRFAAAAQADQAPRALGVIDSDLVLPNVPLHFDATHSDDPEGDALTYHWDFGDGATADEATPTHTFADANSDRTVVLTVSDGQQQTSEQKTLLGTPQVGSGRTPGALAVDAPGGLEFGGVAPGANAVRTLTISNTDVTSTSELRVRLATDAPGFQASPAALDLGPAEQAQVTLTFAPGSGGHQWADLVVLASATNATSAHLLLHGWGGVPPAGADQTFAGPTLAGAPAFYTSWTQYGLFGFLPSGLRFAIDPGLHECEDSHGIGGDICTVNQDCRNPGETCSAASFGNATDPNDFCGDGAGGLFLTYDDSTTDPSPGITDQTGTVARVRIDPATGERLDATLLRHTNVGTQQIACAPAAGAHGRLYLAEYHDVAVGPNANCVRESKETLRCIATNGDLVKDLVDDIDAAANYGTCDTFDPVTDLETTPDGQAVFASVIGQSNPGGIYRIRPQPILVVAGVNDVFFQVHPDGSVIYVNAIDQGATGIIQVYKVFPDQAQQDGPVSLDAISPCTTFRVQNNGGSTRVYDEMFAAGPSAPGSSDGTVLIGFRTEASLATPLGSSLLAQGTIAVASTAGSPTCRVLGLINLQPPLQIRF